MKYETIQMCVYEPGDILDISKVKFETDHIRATVGLSKKAIVVSAHALQTGEYSYRMLTDLARTITLKPKEQVKAKFISHTDLSDLFS